MEFSLGRLTKSGLFLASAGARISLEQAKAARCRPRQRAGVKTHLWYQL